MRHLKKGRKFGRERNQRAAFMKGLASALILKGKIKTTIARAKSLRPYVERLVTYAKSADKALAFRKVGAILPKVATVKLVKDIGPKYIDRKGGYTRITRIGRRPHDAAEMSYIEFI